MLRYLINAGPGTLAHALVLSVRHFGSVRRLYSAGRHTRLGQFRRHRPELLGMVITPFVSAQWNASKRFDAVIDHCDQVDRIGWPLDVGDHEYRRLADLPEVSDGLHLELTAPRWLSREGLLSLALMENETLVFSLSFTLGRSDTGLVAYVGGVQGSAEQNALSTNRRLTRLAHGMRPRDLLIEAFRMLCRAYGVTKIRAVSDATRIHRSAYLAEREADLVVLDYDAVWADRGGVARPDGFFDLPVTAARRSRDEIRPNKRAEYRRRYAMLDTLEAEMSNVLSSRRTMTL